MDLEDENLILCDDRLRGDHEIMGWRIDAMRISDAERRARHRVILAEVERGRAEFARARAMFDLLRGGE